MTQITLRRPDDWHLHLRDGAMLRAVTPETARHFGRAIIMPNLVPPVVTGAQAADYRERIRAAIPEGSAFTPLMTLYLTEETDPADVAKAKAQGIITAVKLYPAGATTNSASGVRDFDKVRPVLETMAEHGIPLCVHGEVVDGDVDIFDREAVFIDRVLDPLRRATPGLRVVMEHITTKDGVDYARAGVIDAILRGDVLHHHPQPRRGAAERIEHPVDEHRLAIEDVDIAIDHLAMHAERNAVLGHGLEHRADLVEIAHARGRVGGGAGGVELHRGDDALGLGLRDIRRVGLLGEVECHQRREGAALGDGGADAFAIVRRLRAGHNRRHEVGHDDGAAEMARGLGGHGA